MFRIITRNDAIKKLTEYFNTEQYSNVGNIGPWTDIYSLGATLYFLSTGQVPLQATDRVIEDTVVPPVNLNPAISTAFSDVIVKALSIRAENRYQNVKAFKEAMIAASDVGATSVVHSSELSEIASSERGKSAEKESPFLREKGLNTKFNPRNPGSRNPGFQFRHHEEMHFSAPPASPFRHHRTCRHPNRRNRPDFRRRYPASVFWP